MGYLKGLPEPAPGALGPLTEKWQLAALSEVVQAQLDARQYREAWSTLTEICTSDSQTGRSTAVAEPGGVTRLVLTGLLGLDIAIDRDLPRQERSRGEAVYRRVHSAARNSDRSNPEGVWALLSLMRAEARAGFWDQAMESCSWLREEFVWDELLGMAVEAGNVEVASRIQSETDDRQQGSWRRVGVAQALARAGRLDEAMAVANAFRRADYRDEALKGIAIGWALHDETGRAADIASGINDSIRRDSALMGVVREYEARGREQEASMASARVVDSWFRVLPQLERVGALVERGELRAAEEAIDQLRVQFDEYVSEAQTQDELAFRQAKEAETLALVELRLKYLRLGRGPRSRDHSSSLSPKEEVWDLTEDAMEAAAADRFKDAYRAIEAAEGLIQEVAPKSHQHAAKTRVNKARRNVSLRQLVHDRVGRARPVEQLRFRVTPSEYVD